MACHVTQPSFLDGRRDERDHAISGPIATLPNSKATNRCCYRSRRPLLSVAAAGSARAMLIRIIASGWRSMIWWRHYAAQRSAHEGLLSRVTRPIGGAQHFHHHIGNRCALPAGYAVERHGSPKVQSSDGNSLQTFREQRALWHESDTKAVLKECFKIVFGRHLVSLIDREVLAPQ